VVDSDVSGVIRFDPKVLLTDGTHEFFYPGMTDHVYFQRTRSSPIRTTDIAFVPLFAGMGIERLLPKRR
jgi:hypothetical protein